MGYPTPLLFRIGLHVACLLSSIGLGNYLESSDEAMHPPQILREPDFTEIPNGESGKVYVHAIGAGELRYQWYHNGVPKPGANSRVLSINNAQLNDGGFYHVEIANEAGTVESDRVRVRVDDWQNLYVIDRSLTGSQEDKTDIEFFKGNFFASGSNGSISKSVNGYAWERLDPIMGNPSVLDLIATDNLLVAVLPEGRVAASSDGHYWDFTVVDEDSSEIEHLVPYDGKFVALVNATGSTRILISTDGILWKRMYKFEKATGGNTLSATRNFILASRSDFDGTEFAVSSDGESWQKILEPGKRNVSRNSGFDDIAVIHGWDTWKTENGIDWIEAEEDSSIPLFEKALQVGYVYYGIWHNVIYESDNGTNWNFALRQFDPRYPSPFEGMSMNFAYGNGAFVVGPAFGSLYPLKELKETVLLHKTDSLSTGVNATSVAYINGQFIIGSDGNEVLLSDTGSQWMRKQVLSDQGARQNVLKTFAYGLGVYTTGDTFGPELDQLDDSPLSRWDRLNFTDIIFANNIFVGINDDGIHYSTDGAHWIIAQNTTLPEIVTFGAGKFVAVGSEGYIAISENGRNWNTMSFLDSESGHFPDFESLVYADSRFIVSTTQNSCSEFFESTDAVNWSRLNLEFNAIAGTQEIDYQLIEMASGGGDLLFMFKGRFFETSDLTTWNSFEYDTTSLTRIGYGNGSFVAIGPRGRIVQIGKEKGIPPVISFVNQNIFSLLPSQEVELLAEAYDIDGVVDRVEFSVDGNVVRIATQPPYDWEWHADKTGVYELRAVAIDDSGMIALDALTVNVSRPGFVSQDVPGLGIHDIAYDGEIYLAVSDEYTMISTDARTWEPQAKPDGMLTSLAFGNGVFAAMGPNNTVFNSSDGLSWVQYEVGVHFDEEADSIQFLNASSEFILEKWGRPVAASIDGADWAEPHEGLTGYANIREVGDHLFALSEDERLYRSANGIDWLPAHENLDISYPVFENDVYLSVTSGLEKSLFRSEDGLNWEVIDSPLSDNKFLRLRSIDSGFLITTKNDNRFGDYFSKDGIIWEEALISLPDTFQRKIIQVNGERFSVIDPIEIPIGGPISRPDSALMRLSSDDLSLSIIRNSLELVGDTNLLRIGVTVSNRGGKPIDTNGLLIDARITDNNHWIESPTNIFDQQFLPEVDLLPGESYSIPLEFELPSAIDHVGRTFHLQLNGDQRIQEINLSNNTAWLRLLPAPEISIEEVDYSNVEVHWSREGGYVERIEYSYDLKNWFLLDAPVDTAESGLHIENVDPYRERYYRVRAE